MKGIEDLELLINDKMSDFLDKVSSLLFLKHEQFLVEYYKGSGLSLDKEYFSLLNKVSKIKNLDRHFLDLYFGDFCNYEDVVNGNIFCLATSLYKIPELYGKSFDEIIEHLSNYSDKKIKVNIIESILYLCKDKIYKAEEVIEDEDKLFEVLSISNINDQYKWRIFQVLKEPKECMLVFIRKLTEIDSALNKSLSILSGVREKWLLQLREYPDEFSLNIIKTLKGEEYMKYNRINIFPTLIPYTATISKSDSEVYLGLGYKVDSLFNVIKGQDDLDSITNLLKSLSDKSKFKILKLLNGKKLYANEIAEILQLTNATISHHMRLMTIQELIKSTRIQNRTYYYSNHEVIEKLINKLSKELLNKED